MSNVNLPLENVILLDSPLMGVAILEEFGCRNFIFRFQPLNVGLNVSQTQNHFAHKKLLRALDIRASRITARSPEAKVGIDTLPNNTMHEKCRGVRIDNYVRYAPIPMKIQGYSSLIGHPCQ